MKKGGGSNMACLELCFKRFSIYDGKCGHNYIIKKRAKERNK
jgi:hypothetical protein